MMLDFELTEAEAEAIDRGGFISVYMDGLKIIFMADDSELKKEDEES